MHTHAHLLSIKTLQAKMNMLVDIFPNRIMAEQTVFITAAFFGQFRILKMKYPYYLELIPVEAESAYLRAHGQGPW